ncbi:protein NRT1/ PTR FAMILY 4.5-like protein isoform X1 [Cinnamomum micranthum f. kanehirae]|uniref:Protein NRT1/ PTR FAMILY 4.5-like protein isoform X1 n=1 Tax=Cinnamomum micranthum f. kanehirae TaxID=337451 RepID=A0A443PD75_9MAGN|nr:protein NRT1/ PTR FAMILY 4.5-like protein isoform X1 [Cinnamomum micranthum f. kanehirae]
METGIRRERYQGGGEKDIRGRGELSGSGTLLPRSRGLSHPYTGDGLRSLSQSLEFYTSAESSQRVGHNELTFEAIRDLEMIGDFSSGNPGGYGLLARQAHLPSLRPPECNVSKPQSSCRHVKGYNAVLLYVAIYLHSIR